MQAENSTQMLRINLLRGLESQRNLMISVATGGQKIQSVDKEYQERQLWLEENLPVFGLQNPSPYDSLWDWYSKWSSGDLKSYQSRRDHLRDLFGPTLQQLKNKAGPIEARAFPKPTGWEKIDRNIGFAQQSIASAQAELDFQSIGLNCRETLIDLAQEVFDSDKHCVEDVEQVSKTDARRMLDAYISSELGGASNEEVRNYAKTALKLANALTHRRTATFREAALCLEATISLVNINAIISGQRDLISKAVTYPPILSSQSPE